MSSERTGVRVGKGRSSRHLASMPILLVTIACDPAAAQPPIAPRSAPPTPLSCVPVWVEGTTPCTAELLAEGATDLGLWVYRQDDRGFPELTPNPVLIVTVRADSTRPDAYVVTVGGPSGSPIEAPVHDEGGLPTRRGLREALNSILAQPDFLGRFTPEEQWWCDQGRSGFTEPRVPYAERHCSVQPH